MDHRDNVELIGVFTNSQFEKLEKEVGGISINQNTSPEQYAYFLGQQSVLNTIRRGYKIGGDQ